MPQIKTTFARLRGLEEGQLQALASRLSEVNFAKNPGLQVVGVDRDYPALSFELVQRTEKEYRQYDDDEKKLVVSKRFNDRVLFCTIDVKKQLIHTPQGRRDLGLFAELLKQCGAGYEMELIELECDVIGWAREMVKMYDTAQLGLASYEHFFVEPKMIGKYQTKTVDNQLNLDAISQQPGRVKSLRVSFFFEGTKRSAELRRDGVLMVSSGDEEDLEHFWAEMLSLATRVSKQPED